MIVWVSFTTRSLIVTISRYYTIPIEYRKPTWNWYDLLLCPTNFRFTAGLNRKIAIDKEVSLLFLQQQPIINNREHYHPFPLSMHFRLLCWEVAPHMIHLKHSSSTHGRIVSKIWSVCLFTLSHRTQMKKSCWDRARSYNKRNTEIWNGTLPLHSDGTAVRCFIDSCDWF